MRTSSKWAKFSKSSHYRLVDLGRPAVFLIPDKKLKVKTEGETVESHIRTFLSDNFGAFTSSTVANFGVWINEERVVFKDRCRVYEVSFNGKHKIPILLKKLAEIARLIGEECIYCKAGQYSCLIYPKTRVRQ
ncbi:MAG: hypothetical protein A2655_00590 [Candidatus Yanofskybacteria bacterium RIFCSPHIGHO2_01_FULL_43_42]|uniref:Uncharacterized protein n=1 Tax=Candidatus Yanofskybacteria bacterium RIFCSPLOWO2_01_FULL_43_22 TaxID=1802695 RepID=A0A1F8GG45_9BACT|nr:MAG: hypothetical protein A2655_00590 [Candidatus Yanofskybacteria bacterium RIFCSPHIGHO2_01_FULL_43_42]OGN13752.1 MAG: hypothetical protein A3D48_00340 [Candidatus Yanofskybacteria bacterium RIFCSPHIGHO2_02_FULL_43_17]OGN24271.1 MAG: hypothetical protein A3A13_03790 [Candidatus Yanofskybacteria bacterium RIFCSPLOWO2_01_FULL_43_22]